ncbi:MAG: hypothetical protein ACAH59_12025 [Pseudobdellovibrionaceae bacterium]
MRFLMIPLLSLFGFSIAPASVLTEKNQQQMSFYLDSRFDAGHDVYYNCQSVEMSVTLFLQQLGAQNVYVRCSGGIDDLYPPPAWPAHLNLSFQSLKTASTSVANPISADWKEISINAFDDCFLLSQIFGKIQPGMDIKDVDGPNHCFEPDSAFHLKLKALIAL